MPALFMITIASLLAGPACRTAGRESAATPDTTTPQERALTTFRRAVGDYVAVHRKAEAQLGPLRAGASADDIAAREKALQAAIRALRPDAKPGEVLVAEARPVLVGIIRGYLSQPEGAPALNKVQKENPRTETPAARIVLKVNGPYQAHASLSTVPSPLLLKLPTLPEELEYRFVGKHLLLLDSTANMIVDFILDVVP